MRKNGIFIIIFIVPLMSLGDGFLDLQAFVQKQTVAIQEAVNKVDTSASNGENWFMENFYFRVRGKAGFDIPWFSKMELVPELEMVFQRPLPEGSKKYSR